MGLFWMLTAGGWHRAGLRVIAVGSVCRTGSTDSEKEGDQKRKRIAGPYPGVFFTNSFAAQVTGVTVLLKVVGMRA